MILRLSTAFVLGLVGGGRDFDEDDDGDLWTSCDDSSDMVDVGDITGAVEGCASRGDVWPPPAVSSSAAGV